VKFGAVPGEQLDGVMNVGIFALLAGGVVVALLVVIAVLLFRRND
jgi:hypothetical protein